MVAENNPENDSPLDPLTSPSWMLEDDDEILLAPPLEEFFTDVAAARSPGPLAPPPKIDDIITGGYTGWVPIIRAGESLAQAEERAQQAKIVNAEIDVVVEVTEVQVTNGSDSVSPEQESVSYVSAPIVDDPDLVSSPSQALDQARKRIAAMRASLQLNLNQVAESFAHPIFTPPTTVATPVEQAPVTQQSAPPIVQSFAPNFSAEEPGLDTVDVTTSSTPTQGTPASSSTSASDTDIPFESPQASRIFTPTETQTQPETQVQAAPADHSLELMIMRDEIKDLRDRLDSSQKLIEELMHRLANLAELALRR